MEQPLGLVIFLGPISDAGIGMYFLYAANYCFIQIRFNIVVQNKYNMVILIKHRIISDSAMLKMSKEYEILKAEERKRENFRTA